MKALLLVEDEEQDATLVRHSVPEVGWRWARTKEQAVRLIDEVDAVVVDLGLPDSDGFDTLAAFLRSAPQLPVVVLTGNPDPALKLQCLEAGAQEYVLKEELDELPQRIQAAIIRQRHRNRALAQALTTGLRNAELLGETLRPSSPVTRAALGDERLSAALPEVFARQTGAYRQLMETALNARMYKGREHPRQGIRKFAHDMAAIGAHPRDIVDLHLAALDALSDEVHPDRLTSLADEGRLLLVEVLGALAVHYRDQASLHVQPRSRQP